MMLRIRGIPPIRAQYPGHVINLNQSEARIGGIPLTLQSLHQHRQHSYHGHVI